MSRPKTSDLDKFLLKRSVDVLTLIFGAECVKESGGDEIDLINVTRGDHQFGSFKFNRRCGRWADFAVEGLAGKGFCQLIAKLDGCGLNKAAKWFEEELLPHLDAGAEPEPEKPKKKRKTAEELKVEPVAADDAAKIEGIPDIHPELGFPSATYRYMTDTGEEMSFAVLRFEADGKKETRPLAWSAERGEWVWRYPPLPLRPYLKGDVPWRDVDSLTGEPKEIPEGIIVVEGEKCVDNAAARFPGWCVMTSARGSGESYATDWAVLKHAKRVLVIPDADGPGRSYALDVVGQALLHGGDVAIEVVDVAKLGWKDGEDIADHDVSLDELLGSTVDAEDIPPEALQAHVATAAASVDAGAYARAKEKLATRLGIGQRDLDKLVKAAKEKLGIGSEHADEDDEEEQEDAPSSAIPWDGPVDGEQLFGEVRDVLQRFIYMEGEKLDAVALWVLLTWVHHREEIQVSPNLMMTSPTKQCGKTTVLETVFELVNKPIAASNLSSAVLFRSITLWSPSLVIDEIDTWLQRDEEMAGILNAGHRRRLSSVLRIVEVDGEHHPKRFSVWAPKAFAGIGKSAADTLIDRSIIIQLQRKPADVRVQRLNPDKLANEVKDLRRKLARWALDADLPDAREEAVLVAGDRSAMNWATLLMVADACSPVVGDRCIAAAKALAGHATELMEDSSADLLADIRSLMPKLRKEAKDTGRLMPNGTHVIASKAICKELAALEDRPWATIYRGQPMTPHILAKMLKAFKVATDVERVGAKIQRGYLDTDLEPLFTTYLVKTDTSQNTENDPDISENNKPGDAG